jgi:uncharacterized protein involved in exopolysaccharide biosynthesis
MKYDQALFFASVFSEENDMFDNETSSAEAASLSSKLEKNMEPQKSSMRTDRTEEKDDDEISLIDLFAVLWQRKVMIIVITAIAMVGVLAFSIISLILPPETSFLPNEYTSEALMLINESSSGGGGISSLLSGDMGGLASLAGISVPGSASNSQLAIYLVGTNTLLDSVVDEFDLITKYEIEESPRAESRERLTEQLTVAMDETSGVLSIGVTDKDPVFAQSVVNYIVNYLSKRFDELGLDKNKIEYDNLELNIEATYQDILQLEIDARNLEQSVAFSSINIPAITVEINRLAMELEAKRQVYTQLKVQYEMLKVAMASEKPVFQILEMPEVPDRKSGPSRGMICIIVTFAAGFFAVFLAFALNAIENIKQDPEAMAKLKPNNNKTK